MSSINIEEIRRHKLNSSFNYDERKLELLVDNPLRISPRILNHVKDLGFSIIRTSMIDALELKSYERYFRKKSDEIFENALRLIKVPINRDLLKSVSSIENPKLVEELCSDKPIEEVLKDEFLRNFSKEGNISYYALDAYKEIHRFKTKKYDSHLLTLLTSTNLVAPIVVSPSVDDEKVGALAYHPMGRKGKLYGLTGQFGGKERLYGTEINLSPFRKFNQELRDKLFMEIFNHEVIGHNIMGLHDHNGMNPQDCLMATKKSDKEYLEVCKTQKDLYLCNSCESKLPISK